jgi:tRNA pseudouridine38-40 synthase
VHQVRYRALVEYDGSGYFGFQRQRRDQPTIQGELENVLQELVQAPVRVTGAGRTDSGVHAMGQVISFELAWQHGLESLQRALNAGLPAGIAVYQLEEAAADFHPRFHATRRAYRYLVYNAPVRSPLWRLRSWHVSRPLLLESLQEASTMLVGEHDFATFGVAPQGELTRREVFSADWRRQEPFVAFRIEANAYLYRMVRSLVGSLVAVGTQSWRVEDFREAFKSGDRSRSAAPAPAQGLYLEAIQYGV